MAMYALKDTTLTALGDAIRSKVGETRIEEVPIEVPIKAELNTDTLILDDSWEKGNGNYYSKYEVYNIDRVSKVKIIYSQTTNALGGDSIYLYINNSPDAYNKEPLNIIQINQVRGENLELSLKNTVDGKYLWISYTISTKSNGTPQWQTAVSAEIYPLDVNGEVITTTPTEVKNTMTPLEMADKINELGALPEIAFNITGDCQYRFAHSGWNWFINNYGDKIITKDITNLQNMFYSSKSLIEIPFDINIKNTATNFSNVFGSNDKLKSVPYIIGPERTPPTASYSGCLNLSSLFQYCYHIQHIPNDWFWKIVPNKDFWDKSAEITTQGQAYMFNNCCSLRKCPDISMLNGVWTSAYSNLYYYLFTNCYGLDEIENLPVLNGNITSNFFGSTFSGCGRINKLTFAVNEDGTPKTAKWKSQTIDLSGYIGYLQYSSQIPDYNSGITIDTRITDDATYQALKDNPDSWTIDINYSRYNHDSAVNTINSLPDCSATGINTIKFKGKAGALTDGGAINTLTEEEIAVATAKGWTVSLV